jgi:adenine/guanine phosphoribosyltransferase-like PRPP-binding protein
MLKFSGMETGLAQENKLSSELESQHWSVLTFDDRAASGLTYEEAAEFVAKHKGKLIGLCIVTDEAARRIHNNKAAEKQQRESQIVIPTPATFSDTL